MNKFTQILSFFFSIGLLGLLLYFLASWLNLKVGSFQDWLIGLLMFSWLFTLVVVPWNIHFEARAVWDEGQISLRKGIKIEEEDLAFARKLANRALLGAVLLHLISAASFFALEHFGQTKLGYWAAAAALLLTLLRPTLRMYEYLSERLRNMREAVHYPREDVMALKNQVYELVYRNESLEARLNEENEGSLIYELRSDLQKIRSKLERQDGQIKTLEAKNEEMTEAQRKTLDKALAEFHREGKVVDQFVANLVELVRFVKRV